MKKEKVPYERTVFVCTNAREGGNVACANPGRGGAELCHALKEAVKAAGLKAKVRVARSGCLDRCAQGPNLFVYPDGDWYSGVSHEDAPELLKTITRTPV